MNVPILITGSLPGQEADNPAVMTTHNLAALCENRPPRPRSSRPCWRTTASA